MGGLDLVAGARLDRYELMLPLAEGGMATVWLARLRGKRGFEQLVAIKTIKPHLSEDMRFEEMFLDEARLASRIRHPNVAQILDLGEERGILYLVMEWVDGDSLSRTRRFVEKKGKKLPPRLALRIMADVCAGLHAAHELKDEAGATLGVVHRDVSPQNVLVSSTGVVKVIDFGIAKARNRASAETVDGLVKGKVAYMSPEQADGLPLDRRADIWSTGVCLYELLTGKLPFDGDSQQEILRLLVKGTAVPPLPSEVPSVIRSVVMQALARDPKDRFLTAAAFERAIEGALVSLDELTSSDDVAAFVNTTCPERETARKEMLASVERVTESLDAGGGGGGGAVEQQTKDVTPPAAITNKTELLEQRPEKLQKTQPMPAVAMPLPSLVEKEAATLHSASVSKPANELASSSRSRMPWIAAALGALLLGGGWLAMTKRTDSPPTATTTAPTPTVSLPPALTASVSSPSASASASPSAWPSPSVTAVSLPSSSLPIAKAQKPVAPKPSATSARSAATVQYDSDGIPIAPKK